MRCERHGLAAATDGLCVLCRREHEGAQIVPLGSRSTAYPVLLVVGILLLTVVAASGYRTVRSRRIAESELLTATGLRRACALEDVRVVVYTTQWCPVCKRAKAWLQENGIAYEERDVETSRVWASELGERNPAHSIPTFDIEGQVSVGLRPEELIAMRERAACRGGESAPSTR